MTTSSLNSVPTVDHTQTRRIMTSLETLTDSLHRSIEDPNLHKILVEVLLKQVTPIVHDLQSTREMNSELINEVNHLRKTNAKIISEASRLHEENEDLKRIRIQEDARRLNQAFDESQKSGSELLKVNKDLEAELADASLREGRLFEHIQELRLSFGRFMKQLVGKYASRPQIERLIDQDLLEWIDQGTENCMSDYRGVPASHEKNALAVPGKQWGGSDSGVGGVGFLVKDMGTLEKDYSHMDNNRLHAEETMEGARDFSKAPSEFSIYTNIIKTRNPEHRVSEPTAIAGQMVVNDGTRHMQQANKELVLDPSSSLGARRDTTSKPVFANASTKNIDIGISPVTVSCKVKERTERKETYPAKSHINKPSLYHRPSDHSHKYHQSNNAKDHIRYADVAGGDMWDSSSSTGSINPQICVADPDEVAGPWNDVPVPLELRKALEPKLPKAANDCPRSVKLLRLPPGITTAMISKFVRGGKVTNLAIIGDGKKKSIKQALVTFLSPNVAQGFHNWVQEFPGSLIVDGLRCLSSVQMSVQPPTYKDEVRVLELARIPRGIDSVARLQEFVKFTTYEKVRRQVSIQEITFNPIDESEYETGVSGCVIFNLIEDAILMKKVWEDKWGLKIKWGHDECEEPLLDMDPMRKIFWFLDSIEGSHESS